MPQHACADSMPECLFFAVKSVPDPIAAGVKALADICVDLADEVVMLTEQLWITVCFYKIY